MDTPISELLDALRAASAAFFATLTPFDILMYVGIGGVALYAGFWTFAFLIACGDKCRENKVGLIKAMIEVVKEWRLHSQEKKAMKNKD